MNKIKDYLVNTVHFPNIFEMIKNKHCVEKDFYVISGPCSIETEAQVEKVAQKVANNKLQFFRGGLFKPRTSPYDFQGLQEQGYALIKKICDKYSLISVSEILDTRDVEDAIQYIDVIQIGSRNMYNTSLLKEVGKCNHPVLLKRGMMATLNEFIMAAEYIVSLGNQNLILCERGIRTFETSTRNTLDISSVAIIKNETSLPIIVDLSHSLGRKDIVLPIANAMKALGADGIMIEVHNNPSTALSDSNQQLSLEEFQILYDAISK
jgi:3-deoxy-7-phosphoheptulonate synthase